MMLSNYEHVLPFVPDADNGDTFVYTEMLDRGAKKGNNANRLLKTFYHRSKAEFLEQLPVIVKLCDLARVRACTRLAPRSYKKVGKEFTLMVTEAALSDNWVGMKTLYNRACGIASPISKRWLLDVDDINSDTLDLSKRLVSRQVWLATIPSKKGLHYIIKPFDMRAFPLPEDVSLHKDNPTNLYIPEGAD